MRRTPIALSLIVIALLAGGGWWWKKGGPSGADVAEAATGAASGPAGAASGAKGGGGAGGPQSVGIVNAMKRDVPVIIDASGTVVALNTVDLRAQTTSTIKDVLIRDGASVKKGQLLFRFDDRADRANVEKARAQLERDRATLNDLDRQHKRAVDLRAQNFVAQNAVDTALANLESQRALIQSDQAALQSAQVALSYNEIRSPLSGRAGTVNVVAGSLVQANSTALPLVTISQLDPITVSFTLPETQLAPVLRGVTGGGKAMEAEASMPDDKGEVVAKGKVTFVDNAVDTSTGTIKLKAEFANEKQQLWPGQYVRVRMMLSTMKDAVVIPQAAIILRGATDRIVYIVDQEKKAQLKPVRILHTFGEMAVVDGIAAGAHVVLDGKQNLRPGTAVREQAAAVNPGAPAKGKRGASAASAASAAASGV